MTASTPNSPRRLLTFAHLQMRLDGAARSTIAGMCQRGLLPQPFKLGTTRQAALRWDAAEVDEALNRLQRTELKRSSSARKAEPAVQP